jgi:hypothetical protein
MTEPSQPPLPPAAFEVMSALVLQSSVTLGDLTEQLKQPPAVLRATLRLLVEEDYAAEATDPTSSAPAYCATAKGRSAFSEQIDWMKRRITDHE